MNKIEKLANRPFRSEIQRYVALTSDDIQTMYAKEGYYVRVMWDMGRVWIEPDRTLSDEEQNYVRNIGLNTLIKKYFKVNVGKFDIMAEDGDQCFPSELIAFIND